MTTTPPLPHNAWHDEHGRSLPAPAHMLALPAACPKHGKQTFEWELFGGWWVCPGFFRGPDGDRCASVILPEHFTPDGGDVTSYDEVIAAQHKAFAERGNPQL